MNLSSIILDLKEMLRTECYSREMLLTQYHTIYKILYNNYHHHDASLLLSLKIINMLVGKYERIKKKIIIQNRPYGLLVDPANGCNFHCPGCVHTLSQTEYDWPDGLLTEESYNNFLNIYAPYACYAFLYNYGEPFLNPLTPVFVKKSKDYLLNVLISSNLSVPRLNCRSIVESGIDTLIVSLDGVSQEIYSKYRRNGNIDIVFDNIRSLVSEKKKTGSTRPYIIWQYLAFEHNAHEISKARKIASDIGVNELHLAKPFSVSWDDPDIVVKENFYDEHIIFKNRVHHLNEDIETLLKKKETMPDFSIFNNLIPIRSCEDNTANHTEECNFLYTTITMDANNRILPCCAAPMDTHRLVFDHFSGNNYSYNNDFFMDARKNTYMLSGQQSSYNNPHCYYCSYKEHGFFDTALFLREYLYGSNNTELRKCIDIIVKKQTIKKTILKAIGHKISKISPELFQYCMRVFNKIFKLSIIIVILVSFPKLGRTVGTQFLEKAHYICFEMGNAYIGCKCVSLFNRRAAFFR